MYSDSLQAAISSFTEFMNDDGEQKNRTENIKHLAEMRVELEAAQRSESTPRLVAIAHLSQEYGGSEEGGWHYTSEEIPNPDKIKIFPNARTAEAFCERANALLDAAFIGNELPLSSTASVGQRKALAYTPKQFAEALAPKSTPTYE